MEATIVSLTSDEHTDATYGQDQSAGPSLPPADPGLQKQISDVIGIFEDEPLWDEVMAEVHAFRKRQAAADAAGSATK